MPTLADPYVLAIVLVYLVLTLAAAYAVFFVVAALNVHSVTRARKAVIKALESAVQLVPVEVSETVRKRTGLTLTFVLLLAGMFLVEQQGKLVAPLIAHQLLGSGTCLSRWAAEYPDAEEAFERDFRATYNRNHQEDQLDSSLAFYLFKTKHGRLIARAMRTLTVLSLLVVLAGICDLRHLLRSSLANERRRKMVRRGATLLVVGLVALIVSAVQWTQREGGYYGNLLGIYQELNAPASLPRSLEDRCSEYIGRRNGA